MVDVAVTNHKLHDRALRIICNLTDVSREEAAILLEKSGRRVKLALLMQKTGLSAAAGQELLQKHRGQLRAALQAYNQID